MVWCFGLKHWVTSSAGLRPYLAPLKVGQNYQILGLGEKSKTLHAVNQSEGLRASLEAIFRAWLLAKGTKATTSD